MNKTKSSNIYFKWYVDDTYSFLKNGSTISLQTYPNSIPISVYTNHPSPWDDLLNDISKKLPHLKTGIDGIWNGIYISYYFDGAVLIATDVKNNLTLAKFSPSFSDENKRLFLSSLMRNHINHHLIYHGYFVYHASAIVQKVTNKSIMILGISGSGKTTFALEAVKSEVYSFLSEDKVIIDPSCDSIYGSPIVHLRNNSKDRYDDLITDLSLINGGTMGKKYQAYIQHQYYKISATVKQIIILNQKYQFEKSFYRKITDKEEAVSIINNSQRALYLTNEKQFYEQACNKLLSYPIYELYHNENELNFQVFMEQEVKL
jgi:hypothetical protein